MPFEIRKVGDKFRLYNLHKKKFAKPSFNSKETAINAGKRYISFREKKASKVMNNRLIIPI